MAKKTFWQSSLHIFFSWIPNPWILLAIVFNLWAGFWWPSFLKSYHVLIFYGLGLIVSLALRPRRKALPETRDRRHTASLFYREFKHAFELLIFLATLNLLLERFEWFKHYEYALLDTFTRGKNTIPLDILVVEITKQDLSQFVLGKCQGQLPPGIHGCPMDPVQVRSLIQHAEDAGAEVIGVDVDTCDATSCDKDRYPAGWDKSYGEAFEEKNKNNVVWAEVPEATEDSGVSGVDAGPWLTLNCLLGNEAPDKHNSGIVRFEQENGIVRVQQAQYKVQVSSDECSLKASSLFPSFHSSVIKTCKDCKPDGQFFRHHIELRTEKVYLNFPAKDLQTVDAHQFLTASKSDVARLLEKVKIVLIGGTFDTADSYVTPFGKMPGVELLADAIASDLHGPILPSEFSLVQISALLVDLVLGGVIVWVYFFFEKTPLIALVASLFAILFATTICAVCFYDLRIWINPTLVMLGMLIHQEYASTHKWQWSLEELRQTTAAIRNLQVEKNRAEMAAWEARLDYLAEKLVTLVDELINRDV